jgi:hypothetical protein
MHIAVNAVCKIPKNACGLTCEPIQLDYTSSLLDYNSPVSISIEVLVFQNVSTYSSREYDQNKYAKF